MRITIAADAANDAAAHRWLDRVVARIEDGWHVWDTSELSHPDEMEATSWFQDPGRQGKRIGELLRSSIRRSAWTSAPHGKRLRITNHPQGPDDMRPEDASRCADEPLTLLVENRESDGAFLKRVVRELDPALGEMWRRTGNPIRVDSVGGTGQMPNEVNRRAARTAGRSRFVVIVDSDRRRPGGRESRVARKLRTVCERAGFPCWVLAKREAENYLPRSLLEARVDAGADHRQRVEAWDCLSGDQKDFFDMKDGLSDSPTGPDLFADLSDDDRSVLASGFGKRVFLCWCAPVHAPELRGRDELERGVALIRSQV